MHVITYNANNPIHEFSYQCKYIYLIYFSSHLFSLSQCQSEEGWKVPHSCQHLFHKFNSYFSLTERIFIEFYILLLSFPPLLVFDVIERIVLCVFLQQPQLFSGQFYHTIYGSDLVIQT